MANIWREPIFDRTYGDVSFALAQISAWKEKHTHTADIVVENERIAINEGDVTLTEDSVVLRTNGVAYIEDGALVVQFGAIYDLKGCLNLSDLTRIEDNITYIASRFTSYRYPIESNNKEWTKDSLPTVQDMKRIGANVSSLISIFANSSEFATVPNTMLSYKDINALEYNLHLLKQMLDAMVGSFIKSNAYKSGSTNRLPIRR